MSERCVPHGLAAGPDGRCALCRRENAQADTLGPPRPRRSFSVVALVVVIVVLALMAARYFMARAESSGEVPGPETVLPAGAVPVTVYVTSWCPVCVKARQWLRANGIPFIERDIERSESAKRDRERLSSKRGVPAFDVDGEVMVGFSEQWVTQAVQRARERRARRPAE